MNSHGMWQNSLIHQHGTKYVLQTFMHHELDKKPLTQDITIAHNLFA